MANVRRRRKQLIDLQEILLAARPMDDWEAAARHFAALAERALDHGALAHARLGYHMASWVRWTQGQWTAAREQTLQAARAVRGGQDEAQIVGMAETAKCLALLERDMSRADAMLMEARACPAQGLQPTNGSFCECNDNLVDCRNRINSVYCNPLLKKGD